MKVYVKGESAPINLTQANYVGEGGEGVVYARGQRSFKIYHDPSKMPPLAKIRELSSIQDDRVIRPLGLILDGRKKIPVGYTMRFIRDAWALCQLFPRSFRERECVNPDTMQYLVGKLQELFSNVHKANVLLVDGNEMNFLVGKRFNDIYGIDAASYQTKNFPASAIMPSVRDWSVEPKDFSELSDWFSFAVVSFQMFTGIHPFKGKHPSVKGLEDRMKAGISVFDPSVKVPTVAYDFSVIPSAYRQWYEALFKQGKRLPPPGEFGIVAVIIPKVKSVSGSNLIDLEDLSDLLGQEGNVRGVWDMGFSRSHSHLLVVTPNGVWFDSRGMKGSLPGFRAGDAPKRLSGIGFTHSGWPIIADHDEKIPTLYDVMHRCPVSFNLEALEVSCQGDNLYMRTPDAVYRIVLNEAADKVIASTNRVAMTLEHASRLYPGCVIQNLLGAVHVSILQGDASHQIRMKELDGYRILDAKFDSTEGDPHPQGGGVLMVVGEKKGQYDRFVFRFDSTDYSYDVRVVEDTQPSGLNFVVLPTGVCVCLNEDTNLELCAARKDSKSIKEVKDPILTGDMRLYKRREQLLIGRGNKLWEAKLKGKKS